MTITVVLLGAGFGLGLWAIFVGLVPPRPSLARALAAVRVTPAALPAELVTTTRDSGKWAAWFGRPAVRFLVAAGLPGPRLAQDLRILGKAPTVFLAEKATLASAGLFLPSVVSIVVAMVGVEWNWQFPLVAGVFCGVGGFLLPDIDVRRNAGRQRASFRYALSAFLNLVRVSLAGGAGVDGALTDSAAIGRGWAFSQIRRALTTAQLTRVSPWITLRQLGEEVNVTELVELASSISLAGTEGAKVRASLAAKATALRVKELTAAEGEAQAATERMSLPVVCLFAGFLVFIGYPAIATVMGTL